MFDHDSNPVITNSSLWLAIGRMLMLLNNLLPPGKHLPHNMFLEIEPITLILIPLVRSIHHYAESYSWYQGCNFIFLTNPIKQAPYSTMTLSRAGPYVVHHLGLAIGRMLELPNNLSWSEELTPKIFHGHETY